MNMCSKGFLCILIAELVLLINFNIAQASHGSLCESTSYSNICVDLGQKSYLIDGNAKLNWFDAERLCRRQNGFLANIESAQELNFISDYLVSKNYLQGDQWFWIGGNDLGSESIFYSIETGNLMEFTQWTPGQPDNAGGNENCVHLWKHGNKFGMNDVGCERKIHFICELKPTQNYNLHVQELNKWIRTSRK